MFTQVKAIDCPYVRAAKSKYPILLEVVKVPPKRGKYIYFNKVWHIARMQDGLPYYLGCYETLHRAVFNAK